jgi:hydrophobic/amphiphilic exporter-1 (mainly G- bacteria), HAE1 family
MNISRLSIRRPVFTVMVVLIVVLLGAVSLSRLPIDLMPDITYPTLSIMAQYENASPEEMEELVTRPIEEAMTAVPGVEEVTSISSEGSSQVRVNFSWGTDLDAAASDIRDRLDRVMGRLPEDVDRPVLRKFDLASFPILILGASSNLDPIEMRRIVDEQIKYRIERVPGVASMDIRGGLDREIHVNLRADKVKALALPLDQILSTIRAENVNIPAGPLERGSMEVTLRTPGEYTSLDDLRDTVIAVRDGAPILLREIADVEDAWERITRIVRVDGRPGIRMAVHKQSGTNTVSVAREVLRELERVNQDLPHIRLIPIIDTSDYIQRSISNVGSSLLYGGLLAVLVLLYFLRNVRSTAIVAVSIPISVIATFALMYFGGFTLNLMTLGGLALGVGMLVDNAIVVLENIFRLRKSDDIRAAAEKGVQEVAPAIIASTVTTLAVFIPIVFMRGMSGVMFKQLSYVVSLALLCSLVAALTLVPMLSARLLGTSGGAGRGEVPPAGPAGGAPEGHLRALENFYRRLLHFALNHRWLVVGGSLACLAGSVTLIPLVGVEFMPATDEGEVRVNAEMAVGTRLGMTDEQFLSIEKIVQREVPEMKNMVTFIGGSFWRGRTSHAGEIRIALTPLSQRERSSEEIANDLRRKLRDIPGVTIRTRAGQGLFILRMGTGDADRIQVDIRGHDLEVAESLALRVKELLLQVEGVTDARESRESGSPEELIMVDRRRAADMKLTVSDIANMLRTVLSGTRAGDFREGGNEYRILVKIADAERIKLTELLDLTLTNRDGEPVVLRNVVDVRPWSGPVLIERKDQERVVSVSANYTGRDMGSVVEDVRRDLRTIPVPRDFSIVLAGDYEEQQKAFRELLLGFVLALLLVYMVMAALYESLRDPFVVMFSVPLAVIGIVLMLLLTDTTFNVQSYIGCIMLGGIVVNNAILLVDYTNLLRRRDGMGLLEAIEEAGRRRLRPILMTAATTILALVPLALGLGEGGEAQAPMARAVIGGLLSSTLITLVFVPTVYSLFEGGGPKKMKETATENAGANR